MKFVAIINVIFLILSVSMLQTWISSIILFFYKKPFFWGTKKENYIKTERMTGKRNFVYEKTRDGGG